MTHRHCSECGSDYEGTRSICDACILAEHDEHERDAKALLDAGEHEADPDRDHEPEHAAEAEEG